eukprot:494772-Pyramimonas_sp.AAC.1
MVRDANVVNSNLVAKCEVGFDSARQDFARRGEHILADGVPTVFSLNCAAHCCVLSLKPILNHYPGLSSFVIRRGHLCQSWRSSKRYESALETVIASSFEFRQVVALPDNFNAWQNYSRNILTMTGHGLTDEQQLEILRYDNGDWTSERIFHWCPPDCLCGRSRASALARITSAIKLSVGATCPLALEY